MSQQERAYFRSIILKTVGMFADPELGAWSTVFSMLKFPHARDIIEDIGASDTVAIYTESVENLIERIGLCGPATDVNAIPDTAPARQAGL